MLKILFAILCLGAHFAYADQKAITESGQEVILYQDGRWAPRKVEVFDSSKTRANRSDFVKAAEATFLIRSKANNAAVYLDPKKWGVRPSRTNSEAEYQFTMKGKDLHAFLIAEKVEVPLEFLANSALQTMQNNASEARIVKQEYRRVNGKELIYLQIDATINGIGFSYFGHYYSDENGTTQLVAYTGQNLGGELKEEAARFINGLVFPGPTNDAPPQKK